MAYAGAIRNRKPVVCSHGDMGRFLCGKHTLNAAPFPDPADTEVWRHTPLWQGNNPASSISYAQHADSLKSFLAEADIRITKVRASEGTNSQHAWRARSRVLKPALHD